MRVGKHLLGFVCQVRMFLELYLNMSFIIFTVILLSDKNTRDYIERLILVSTDLYH